LEIDYQINIIELINSFKFRKSKNIRKSTLLNMTDKIEIPEPKNLPEKKPESLGSSILGGFSSVAEMITGLDKNKIAPDGPSIEEVKKEIKKMGLRKRFQVDDVEDCTERATWALAHIRHMYPGIAIGMVEGTMSVGQIVDKRHAVLVVWDKDLKPNYIDPQQIDSSVDISLDKIKRITSIPFALDAQEDTNIEPFASIGRRLVRPKKQYVHWDARYWIYPTNTITDYLKKADFENNCEGMHAHNVKRGNIEAFWKTTDAAFWAYVHLRRDFPGCATGIAYGTRNGKPGVLNLIFTENDGRIKPMYWMQARLAKNRGEILDFLPEIVFF
jgi:hypothetical protein